MQTHGNNNRTTGAQDQTQSKAETLEGFKKHLKTLGGIYTLLITQSKYKGARHIKQAYNSRLTIQMQKKNHNRRNANYIYNILIFAKKYHLF